MSEKIKAVYLDSYGNQHDTKAAAKKANRLIDAFDGLQGADLHEAAMGLAAGDCDTVANTQRLVEFARSIVAIYGMKDKAQ